MTPGGPRASLRAAYDRAVDAVGEEEPRLRWIDADPSPTAAEPRFPARHPDRYVRCPRGDPGAVARALERAAEPGPVFVTAPAAVAAGRAYADGAGLLVRDRPAVKVVGTDAGVTGPGVPAVEDVGVMRGVPGMTVIVPADGPTVEAAVRAVAVRPGPAYLRLAPVDLPTVSDAGFEIGRARLVGDGADVTVVAVGTLVERAVTAAAEMRKVGVGVRVLDLASVKPFDEPALLRAARDTGALLTAEEHTVVTGVGALVAAATAENYPVPVRRVGLPDTVLPPGDPADALDRHGLSVRRLCDELYELLRARGKVE